MDVLLGHPVMPDGTDRRPGPSLERGAHLGQYVVIGLRGRGGMGEVYEVEHTALGKRYALKLLPHGFAKQPDAVERFRREARIMSQFDHPNLVRVDDFGHEEGRYWLRMELAEGIAAAKTATGSSRKVVSLQDLMEAHGGKIPVTELLPILAQVLDGLAYAHARGAVHCDLKPSNILLWPSPLEAKTFSIKAKVADFGLVRLVGEKWLFDEVRASIGGTDSLGDQVTLHAHAGDAVQMAGVHSLVGTYEYMSPEQRRGEPVETYSDIYGFGLMAHRLLTGGPPGLRRPRDIVRELPLIWDQLIFDCLEENPVCRPSASALCKRVLAGEHGRVNAAPMPEMQREAVGAGDPPVATNRRPDRRPGKALTQDVVLTESRVWTAWSAGLFAAFLGCLLSACLLMLSEVGELDPVIMIGHLMPVPAGLLTISLAAKGPGLGMRKLWILVSWFSAWPLVWGTIQLYGYLAIEQRYGADSVFDYVLCIPALLVSAMLASMGMRSGKTRRIAFALEVAWWWILAVSVGLVVTVAAREVAGIEGWFFLPGTLVGGFLAGSMLLSARNDERYCKGSLVIQ